MMVFRGEERWGSYADRSSLYTAMNSHCKRLLHDPSYVPFGTLKTVSVPSEMLQRHNWSRNSTAVYVSIIESHWAGFRKRKPRSKFENSEESDIQFRQQQSKRKPFIVFTGPTYGIRHNGA